MGSARARPGWVIPALVGLGAVGGRVALDGPLGAAHPGALLVLDVAVYVALATGVAWSAVSMQRARARADASTVEAAARARALAQSEERYRSFIQRSSEGIWRIELAHPVPIDLPEDEQIARFYRDGRLAECNDAMARMYGFNEAADLTNVRLGELVVPTDPANRAYLLAFVRSGYRLLDGESHERDRHGETKYFLNNLVGVVEDGCVVRAWGTQRDVSESRRTAEELKQSIARLEETERQVQQLLDREREARAEAERSNRAKDEFLATLSHELRSPLSAALSWAQLLRRGQLDAEKTARALETIERTTRLQVRLIEDILDISRVVSGKLTVERGVVDLGAVVVSAVDAMRAAAEGQQIALEVQDPNEVLLVGGDALRLEQVVGNLVGNAIKFTPAGGRVTVTWWRDDGHAELVVRDTGIGIEPDVLPHVFDRFRQADSSTTRRHGGLGLGLAIAKHLVDLHGGAITAESAGEGHGTLVRVRLPLELGGEARPSHVATRTVESGDARQLAGILVLVVDDEPDIRASVETILTSAGATVVTAESAAAALQAAAARVPTIVVSDLAMPGRDGFALLRALRASGARMPVLALTALASTSDRRRALADGFGAYLVKPLDPPELVAAVRRASQVAGC